MAKNNIIDVFCFDQEIGKVGFDENKNKSFFQYHPLYLKESDLNIFPETGVIKRIPQIQVFSRYNNETFKNLPPQIADSLPDLFGNIIFQTWLETQSQQQISSIEQLAYISNRGMGALEYQPSKEIPDGTTIHLGEIIEILKQILSSKNNSPSGTLNHKALLNIFKIGTSAGGARPKILVSEHKTTKEIIPGDLNFSNDYNHLLVKLSIEESLTYNRERVEYCYYLTATHLKIRMMDSKLIEDQHFATLRYDRIKGKKKHVLTATGLTGWDFSKAEHSTYENLFELALFLKIPHKEVDELFRRMVFNVIFRNDDDHLKNHSFIYNELEDKWNLSPAYDLTYSLNPLINYKRTSRALSINDKRIDIRFDDIQEISVKYTIKNVRGIVREMQDGIDLWINHANKLNISAKIIDRIVNQFKKLI